MCRRYVSVKSGADIAELWNAPAGPCSLRNARFADGLIAERIHTARPSAMVVDVSVEVIAFARLMGVRVITLLQPGSRADPAHQLGYALAEELIAPWPKSIGADLADGTQQWTAKMRFTGAFFPLRRASSDPAVNCSAEGGVAPRTGRSHADHTGRHGGASRYSRLGLDNPRPRPPRLG
jgi:hypothetical protein